MPREKLPVRLETTKHPLLYEVNIRVLINELSLREKKKITLATIPEDILDEWAALGFDAVWLMGVWTTGPLGRKISLDVASGGKEFRDVLPDIEEVDVIGSPYAVQSYVVSPLLGGNSALDELRKRLRARGIGLVLDFVANHTARDHRWVKNNPDLYINGVEGDDGTRPAEFFPVTTAKGKRILAFGRDPLFPGWTDTAQLNYFNPELREKMIATLGEVAERCDGVRCDMAMLIMNGVFEGTWRERVGTSAANGIEREFWSEAVGRTREKFPRFLFLAEAYWDTGWDLQNLGFDFTYDKRLYDRLLKEGAGSVFEHLQGDLAYQLKLIRFIENHDERRASDALSTPMWHCAAAAVMSAVPGMVMFHEGQLDGRAKRVPVQLGRRPKEDANPIIRGFYRKLLECLASPVFRQGDWSLLHARPAWHDNPTWGSYLAFWWEAGRERRLVVVNYSPHGGQCYVPLPLDPASTRSLEFRDLVGADIYSRQESTLVTKGMFFDLPGYTVHLFAVIPSA